MKEHLHEVLKNATNYIAAVLRKALLQFIDFVVFTKSIIYWYKCHIVMTDE